MLERFRIVSCSSAKRQLQAIPSSAVVFDDSEAWVSEMRRQERELQARFGQRMIYARTKSRSEPGNVGTTAQVLGNAHSARMNPLL
jgi:hypothetical protein